MTNWNDLPQVIKGTFAEQVIDTFLESHGYIVYEPKTEGPHSFDRLAIKNKEQVIIAEVKAKARRNFYPDTGVDVKSYEGYKAMRAKHDLPVFIFFVDELEGRIYGNFLDKLEEPKHIGKKVYPSIEPTRKGKNIIYFPLENMRHIATLTDEQVCFLKTHNTRNYEY